MVTKFCGNRLVGGINLPMVIGVVPVAVKIGKEIKRNHPWRKWSLRQKLD